MLTIERSEHVRLLRQGTQNGLTYAGIGPAGHFEQFTDDKDRERIVAKTSDCMDVRHFRHEQTIQEHPASFTNRLPSGHARPGPERSRRGSSIHMAMGGPLA